MVYVGNWLGWVMGNKADVVLFEADGIVGEPSQVVRQYTNTSLALKALKANLNREGYSTSIISQGRKTLTNLAEEISSYNPKLVGATATTCEIPATGEVMRMLKNKDNGLVTVIGGYHVSACPEMINPEFAREHGADTSKIDYAVLGEGERTMNELVGLFVGRKSSLGIDGIDGIAYMNSNGELVKTAPRKRIANLDELPRMDWSKEELKGNIFRGMIPGLSEEIRGNVISTVSERGCPFSCNFCATQSTYGNKVSTRSIKNFVDEINWLVKEKGTGVIVDYAPTTNRSPARIHEFCEEIRKRNLDHRFGMYALWRLESPDGRPMIDESMVDDLSSTLAGLKIGVGIEALSEQDQAYLNKRHSLEHLQNVSGWFDKHGALLRGLYMITPETTKETILKCRTSKVLSLFDDFRISFLTPFNGTPLYEELKDNLITSDWKEYDCENPVLRPTNMSRDEFASAPRDAVQGLLLNPHRRERIRAKIDKHPTLQELYSIYDKNMACAGFEVSGNSI